MSYTDQIPQIWTQAVARYEQITEATLDVTSLRGLATVEALLECIETEHKSFSDFRSRRARMFSALKSAMLPIQLVGDLASTGAQLAFPPAAIIFDAVKYLIDAAGGVSAKYDAIVDLMSTLKDFTVRLGVYAQQQISEPLQYKLTEILTTMLEIFAIARAQISRGRLKAFGKNILLGNDEGRAMIDKLKTLIDSERGLVGAETLSEVKVASTTIRRVDSNIVKLAQHLKEMNVSQMPPEQSQEKRNRDHVKRVLQPTTSADDRCNAINRSRVSGTGDWIHEEKSFQDWISRAKPLLWVIGTPGSGKTYIASNIIAYLKRRFPQNVQHPSHASVAYFFFKDDDIQARSVHQALCDVAFKIAQNDPMYAKHIVSRVDSRDEIATLPSLWQKLYVEFFLENDTLDSTVYIVLDAVDEAFVEDRREFFEVLKDLQQGGALQCLMLGRPHIAEEIDEIVDTLAGPTIYVSDLNNSDDIVRYIKGSIAKSVYLKRASKALQSEIVDRLSTGAQGMFLWVDFMLKELLKKRDEPSMRKALDEAPQSLSQMIQHVLKGISESLKDSPKYADDLNEMLAWATCSTRPLSLEEMESVLKWRSESGDGWIWLEGHLRRQYASLFVLNREDGLTTAELQRTTAYTGAADTNDLDTGFEDLDNLADFNSDPTTTHITLTHASLGDFFRSEQNSPIAAEGCPPIGLDIHQANVMLFKRYYEILSCPEDSPKADLARILLIRASSSVIYALREIEIKQCSLVEKQIIGLYLARLVSDPWTMPRFVGYTGEIPPLDDVLSVFMSWFMDPEVQGSLPPEEKSWCHSFLSGNVLDIFLPCIRYIAGVWLKDSPWNSDAICVFIHDYLYARGTSPVQTVDSAEVTIDTAEWCGLEKNAVWHRRLAMALRDLGFVDRSIEYFQKAIELGSAIEGWLSRAEMAVAFLAKQEYSEAIAIQEVCKQQLDNGQCPFPEEDNQSDKHIHRVLESLGMCHNQLGNYEQGMSLYKRAFAYDNTCNTCVRAILASLHMQERYEEIISMVREMDETIPETETTRLSKVLMANSELSDALSHWLATAAYHTSNTSYLIQAYTNAVLASRKERKAVQTANLELCLGVWHQIYGHDSARAARIWERLINTYRGSRTEGEITSVLETASNLLATHYFTQAMEVGVDTAEGRGYGEILELLAAGKALYLSDIAISRDKAKDASRAERFVTNSEVGLIMANYYNVAGRNAEATACYRAQVGECIRLLSDNDPSNDGMAFGRLAGVFAGTGDDARAISMWHKKYVFAQVGEGPNNTEEELVQESTICKACHRLVELRSISICRYCWDVILCDSCLPLRENGTLAVNICSQKHDWIRLPSLRAKEIRPDGQKDTVFMGDGWISVDELKRRLREEWEIKDKS